MPKAIDLTGKKFGHLVVTRQFRENGVKYCECVCDCDNHTVKIINASNLTSGLTKSCGCLLSESARNRRFKSAIGMRFVDCEVIDEYINDDYRHIVKCKCSHCGNVFERELANMKKAKMNPCSCVQYFKNPLKGQQFGKWKVLDDLYNEKHEHICLCECSCENHVKREVLYSNLIKGLSKSCGCNIDEARKARFISHKGEVYGDLYIIDDYMKDGINYCKCKCSCGRYKIVRWSSLNNGSTTSCNHIHKKRVSESSMIDLTGKKFGKLTVINRYGSNSWGGVTWKCHCSLCGEDTIINSSTLINGAISCGCDNIAYSGSKNEKEIKEFIKSICGKEGKKVRNLDGKEIDLYYDGIGIEYNGSPYHATVNSRFSPKDKLYHQQKFLLAKEKGIHLINIFDVDWETNKDRIKMYLSSLFVQQKRLIARKCEIKKIDNELACEFADKYHIQGSNKNTMKINYGLYYNNELMAIMGFGKLRLSKTENGQYELHRYCVKDSYNIVGGANKLLKAFERDYNPKYILSYSDNDYFLGGIYERLGFDNKGQCTPRYYWYLNGKEIKRERCRLSRLKVEYPDLLEEAYSVNAPNKEDYVMIKLGACKVYRSGNTKWEKFY